MIVRRNGREVTFLEDDGETVRFRCILPEGGISLDELERFREHLLKLSAEQEVGPS